VHLVAVAVATGLLVKLFLLEQNVAKVVAVLVDLLIKEMEQLVPREELALLTLVVAAVALENMVNQAALAVQEL
jgi:hypothetical protein